MLPKQTTKFREYFISSTAAGYISSYLLCYMSLRKAIKAISLFSYGSWKSYTDIPLWWYIGTQLSAFTIMLIFYYFWIKKVDPTSLSTTNPFRIHYLFHYFAAIFLSFFLFLVYCYLQGSRSVETLPKEAIKYFSSHPFAFFVTTLKEITFRQYIFQKILPFGRHKAVFYQMICSALVFLILSPSFALMFVLFDIIGALFYGYLRLYINNFSFILGLHSGMSMLLFLFFL